MSGEDARYPTAQGVRRDLPTRLGHRYFDLVARAAMKNRAANQAFVDVMSLLASPVSLFRPSMLFRALTLGRDSGEKEAADPPGTAHRPEPLREGFADERGERLSA